MWLTPHRAALLVLLVAAARGQTTPCTPQDCSDHGTCNTTGTCVCQPGYRPPTGAGSCGTSDCTGVDCGHGTCTLSGPSSDRHTCVCKSGWDHSKSDGTGPCDKQVCTPDCGDHGTCTDGACVCKIGWNGAKCDHATGCDSEPCGAHGQKCAATGGQHTCTCKGEWTGVQDCNTDPCLSQPNACGDHGTCATKAEVHSCTCKDDYVGGACTLAPCDSSKAGFLPIHSAVHTAQGGCTGMVRSGENCSYTCRKGYTKAAPAGSSTCTRGDHKNSNQCDPITCLHFRGDNNAIVKNDGPSEGKPYEYNVTIEVVCLEGYQGQSDGQDVDLVKYQCQYEDTHPNGIWQPAGHGNISCARDPTYTPPADVTGVAIVATTGGVLALGLFVAWFKLRAKKNQQQSEDPFSNPADLQEGLMKGRAGGMLSDSLQAGSVHEERT